jgi:hypothetical protein
MERNGVLLQEIWAKSASQAYPGVRRQPWLLMSQTGATGQPYAISAVWRGFSGKWTAAA